MIIINIFLIISLIIVSIYFSITDLKYNLIKNSVVVLVSSVGVTISSIVYAFVDRRILEIYWINILIAIVLAVILYVMHVWAAGDSKLYICLAILSPVELCFWAGRYMPTGIFIGALAFLFGFLYLIGETIQLLLTKEIELDKKNIGWNFKLYLKQYFFNIAFVTALLLIEDILLPNSINSNKILVSCINILIILLYASKKKRHAILVSSIWILLSLGLSLTTHSILIDSQRCKYYIIVIVVMFVRIIISEGNYKTISSADVKRGMILSTASTMMMANSSLKNIPSISREDMRDRLTEEQALAVRNWGNTKDGILNVSIVKKVPFAIFFLFGVISYYVIWGIYNFAN